MGFHICSAVLNKVPLLTLVLTQHLGALKRSNCTLLIHIIILSISWTSLTRDAAGLEYMSFILYYKDLKLKWVVLLNKYKLVWYRFSRVVSWSLLTYLGIAVEQGCWTFIIKYNTIDPIKIHNSQGNTLFLWRKSPDIFYWLHCSANILPSCVLYLISWPVKP